EHLHQSLRDSTLVAQRRQIPPVIRQLLADPPVRQQAGIGIGGVRQPVQQRRQQHLLDPPPPAAAAGQGGQVRQRALRALVAKCSELTFGGLRRHSLRNTNCDNRFQQWLIEQLGVQTRYPHVLALELFAQHALSVVATVGSHVRRTRQPAQRLLVVF